ncbi:hypothetical protein ACOPJQ_02795 [Luteimonas dalianensis]|uniref:hypothetical protein n=1 Tax=Luteimonas dalianensis TaxID=1148196 RepID=UPI003BF24A78
MELLPSAWSVISTGAVFVSGAFVCMKLGPRFRVGQRRSLLLYVWHSIFCVVYVMYVSESGGDALMYYDASMVDSVDFTFGTAAVLSVTRLFSYFLGLSILGVFSVFNIIGTVGLLAFDGALRHGVSGKSRGMRRVASILVFLPSVSFWSSAIGKDAISFCATGLALWAAIDMKRRFWLMGVAVLLMLSVRPHMAVLLSVALAVSVVFNPRVSLLRRCVMGIAAAGASAVLIPLAIGTSGLGNAGGVEAVADYVERRQGYNMEGGGGVDISSMSLPMKMFTYLFRPLPFEAHNLPSFAASIDNMVLLGLTFLGVWSVRRGRHYLAGVNWMFLLAYSLFGWLLLSLTTANLGISMRQKWMFVPMVIFLLVSVIGARRGRDARDNF